MRIHYLQHVSFEGLGNIEDWALLKEHQISCTRLFKYEPLPEMDEFDWLIIMGGPMNIYQENEFPWLGDEKVFIKKAINTGKLVLGICLGAQLIADVLGTKVYQNRYPEIGWFEVKLTDDARNSKMFNTFPECFTAFHWHGDTFDLPPKCVWIAQSDACKHQAFEYDGRVVGLQFHLDTTIESIRGLIKNCSDELNDGVYIQSETELMRHLENLKDLREYSEMLLDVMEAGFSK
ncbi:MAG: type 1 glutamine amidotransferase [Methanosarcinales archaeon]|nr:type 1 glutamine amidotransferase [Methanosarcinales archaeon]